MGVGVPFSRESDTVACGPSEVIDSPTGGRIGAHIPHPVIIAPRMIFGPFFSISLLLVSDFDKE